MILYLSVVVVAVVAGYAFGGRMRRFEGLSLKWWWLVLAGFALQFVPLPGGNSGTDLLVRTVVLSISYTMLVTFAAANVRLPGMPLVVLGLACNFAVIAVNGGMPVGAEALRDSGQTEVIEMLREGGAQKHHLLHEGDSLTFLADVIPLPPPIAQAISIGDVFVYAGLIFLMVQVMRGRTPTRLAPRGPYHGKHRPGEPEEEVPVLLPVSPPGATRSGSAP